MCDKCRGEALTGAAAAQNVYLFAEQQYLCRTAERIINRLLSSPQGRLGGRIGGSIYVVKRVFDYGLLLAAIAPAGSLD